MTDERFDVQLGDIRYRVAEEYAREVLGIPGFRRYWREAKPEVGGATTGTDQSTNPNERRWVLTDFRAGEGQKVLTAGDIIAEQRYDRSNGIDFAIPNNEGTAFRLNRSYAQTAIAGTTGAGTTTATVEASSFSDLVGVSTIVNTTDRRLNVANDEIFYNQSFNAGQHEVTFHAYADSSGATTYTFEGNSTYGGGWNAIKGKRTIQGTDVLFQMGGDNQAVIQHGAHDPADGIGIRLVAYIKGNKTSGGDAKCRVALEVRDAGTGTVLQKNSRQLKSTDGDYGNFRQLAVNFNSQAGKTYNYRLILEAEDGTGRGAILDKITEFYQSGLTYAWFRVMDGAAEVAVHRTELSTTPSSQVVAQFNFSLTSTKTLQFRIERDAVTSTLNVIADKVVYTTMAAGTPFKDVWNIELGQGGEIWASDYDAAAATSIAKWSVSGGGWSAVADIGPIGGKVIAWAHTSAYEYALLDNGQVFRLAGTTGTQYTAAHTGPVGIAVAGNRLYILTENVTNGTRLFEYTLDATAGLPFAVGTAVYQPITQGITPDTTITRRMTGTTSGPVFFVNQAAECAVFAYNSVTTSPSNLANMSGFKARGIWHDSGLNFLIGEQPQTAGGTKAAMFVIDDVTGPSAPEQLNLPFERDGDPDSYLQDIQVYGPNVWVLAHVATTSPSPTMRLWRVSLSEPGGLFQEADVLIPTGKKARALAITDSTRILASDQGGPYVAQTNYVTGTAAYLRSSLHSFGLLDTKRLKGLSVAGLFPTGTSCVIRYSLDNGTTWLTAGTWTAEETKSVPTTDADTLFRNLQVEIVPIGTATATPTIYQVEAIAEITRGLGGPGSVGGREQVFAMVLDCRNETATNHIPGQQNTGYQLYNYVWSLLSQAVVPMEERYYTPGGASYLVEIDTLDLSMMGVGEGLLRVEAVER